jgi:hypothetical protein
LFLQEKATVITKITINISFPQRHSVSHLQVLRWARRLSRPGHLGSVVSHCWTNSVHVQDSCHYCSWNVPGSLLHRASLALHEPSQQPAVCSLGWSPPTLWSTGSMGTPHFAVSGPRISSHLLPRSLPERAGLTLHGADQWEPIVSLSSPCGTRLF